MKSAITIYSKLLAILLCLGLSTPSAFTQAALLEALTQAKGTITLPVVNEDETSWVAVSTFSEQMTLNPSVLNLHHFDACGQILWTKKYSHPNQSMDVVDFIKSTDDFLYLMGYLVDTNNNNNRDIFLLKLRLDGSEVFFISYGGFENEYPYSLQETVDGQLMIYCNQHVNNNSRNTFLIVEPDGSIDFAQSYNNIGIWGRALACSDGGFLARNSRTIYKLDAQMNVLWANNYSLASPSSPFIEVPGGYVAAAFKNTSENPYFVYKLDENGQLLWQSEAFNGEGSPRVQQLSDGSIICLNYEQLNLSDPGLLLQTTIFSADGTTQQRGANYIATPPTGLRSPKIAILPNDGFLFTSFNDPDKTEVLIGKTKDDIFSLCEVIVSAPVIEQALMEVEPVSMNPQIANFNITDQTLVVEELDRTIEQLCFVPDWEFPSLPADQTICEGESLLLDVGLEEAQYLWQDGSVADTFEVRESGMYSVTITRCGISEESSVQVTVEDCPCHLEHPNAFTPDGDSNNDFFAVVSDCPIQQFDLRIYNRWGQLVFHSNDSEQGWDGKFRGELAPMDVYLLQYQYEFDRPGREGLETVSGQVTLIR